MIKAYKEQVRLDNPKELSRNIFNSIRLYLEDYKDTSNTKDFRLKSLEKAHIITEWVVLEIGKHASTFEQELVHYGLNNILTDINIGITLRDNIMDMKDHISFLKILAGTK